MLDLVLAAGVVAFGVDCAAASLHCASSSDCDIDLVSRWAGAVACTLGTDWVLVGFVVCTLRTDGVVLSGVAKVLAMVGCWWMA